MFNGWQQAGADIEWLDEARVARMSGCQGYGLGWLAKRGGSVQPLSYARSPDLCRYAPGYLGLHAGLGCNGRGVAMSTVMGRLLAETVLGKPAAELPLPVTVIKKYPFHRFHRTGIRLLVPWKEFLDRREAG